MDDYDSYMHLRTGALQGKIKKRKRTMSFDSENKSDNDDNDFDIKSVKKVC